MNHIPSISRSGGLDQNANLLKDRTVQADFLRQIKQKFERFLDKFPLSTELHEPPSLQRRHEQENILIQLRKLREGLISSYTVDAFVVEVYEFSFFLAVIFNSTVHFNSSASRLVPDLYKDADTAVSINDERKAVTFVYLLRCLVDEYPSQTSFRSHLNKLHQFYLDDSQAVLWMRAVASALLSQNYTRLSSLISAPEIDLLHVSKQRKPGSVDLARQAIKVGIWRLRQLAQKSSWLVIRTAYREFSFGEDDWIKRSLCFDTDTSFQAWVEERTKQGDIKPKPGGVGRWIIQRTKL